MLIDASQIQPGTYEAKMESFDKNTSTKFTLWTDTIQIIVTQIITIIPIIPIIVTEIDKATEIDKIKIAEPKELVCNLDQDIFTAYISDIEGPIKLEAQLGNESFDFKNYAAFKKLAEQAFKLEDE